MKTWFTITNKSDKECVIEIYGEIGDFGITLANFMDELKGAGARHVTLRINSDGGEVFAALAMYNRLRDHAPGVTTKIDGIAASAASFLAMAGSPIQMAENALVMMHPASGLCMGQAEDMREIADMLDKVTANISGIYEKKTGKSPKEIKALMDAEEFLDAKQCLALGLIDEITEPIKIAANCGKLKIKGKLEAREKTLDDILKNDKTSLMAENIITVEKTAAEIELERIEAKRVADEAEKRDKDHAAAVKDAREKGAADENQRVTDITTWADEVSKLRKIDLSKDVAEFTKDKTKTVADFKEHVLKNEFKAKPLITATDANTATGKTMTRAEFAKLSPFNRAEFCRKGGKITEPKLRLYQEVEA